MSYLARCDYCGKDVSLFQRVGLADGHVCKNCFHWANYGGYGYDDGMSKKLAWIDIGIKKRNAEVDNFVPTISTRCGLRADDNQKVFIYQGWTHSYMSLYSFRSFINGRMQDDSCRRKQNGNHFKKPIKYAQGPCVFIQLHGYTYPSYISIDFQNKQEFDECISCLYHITDVATKWENGFSAEMDTLKKADELARATARLERELKEIERLKKELGL